LSTYFDPIQSSLSTVTQEQWAGKILQLYEIKDTRHLESQEYAVQTIILQVADREVNAPSAPVTKMSYSFRIFIHSEMFRPKE
jgi:hypothetical protein